MAERVLLTGGAGYIGSHVALAFLRAGYDVSILDNFSNSSPEAVRRVEALSGAGVALHRGDVRDPAAVLAALEGVDGVVHLAGLKAVGESMANPALYYEVNVGGTAILLQAMVEAGARRLIFSSSATVYGEPESSPIREDFPTAPANPYGRSKLMVEEMLSDLSEAQPDMALMSLRYFNPVGADESGDIGEDPLGPPANLFPFIAQTAIGIREKLRIFGDDWETRDGTGVRDYIHVSDLAEGHLAGYRRLEIANGGVPHRSVNLGTGGGVSVLEALAAFSRAAGRDVPHEFAGRRPGDIAEYYADPAEAERALGWRATRSLDDMCRDHWRWQSRNPRGYAAATYGDAD